MIVPTSMKCHVGASAKKRFYLLTGLMAVSRASDSVPWLAPFIIALLNLFMLGLIATFTITVIAVLPH
jgi:hypothetical protein